MMTLSHRGLRMARRLGVGLIAVGLVALAPRPLQAQEGRESAPPVGEPRDFRPPDTRSFALSNGMRVTLAPYGWLPKVTARLAVRAGNVNEAADQVWLADLTGDGEARRRLCELATTQLPGEPRLAELCA